VLRYLRPNTPGSLAMFGAMRRASSLVSSFAADRRAGSSSEMDISERLALAVSHDEAEGSSLADQGGGKRRGVIKRPAALRMAARAS